MSIENIKIENNERLSFIKAKAFFKAKVIASIVIAALSVVAICIPQVLLFFKVMLPVSLIFLALSIVSDNREGVFISTDGKIKITCGLGTDTFDLKDVKRIAVNFTEWENEEFSTQIKIVFNEGDVYNKNYAAKFENTSNHLFLNKYTLPKSDIDVLCAKLEEMNICNITVIDINKDITYQSISTKV